MEAFLNTLVEFFGTPAIVLGFVSLVGLLVQKKKWQEVFSGTLKSIVGYLIMQIGIGALIGSLLPMNQIFGRAFDVQSFFSWDEPLVGAVAPVLGRETAYILLFGFLLNVLFARLLPTKYIYLTGHHLWVHAGEIAILMWSFGLSPTMIIVVGSVIAGLYYVLSPAFSAKYMKKLTGKEDYVIGHGNNFKYWVSLNLARLFGEGKGDTEKTDVKGLAFLRDMAVSMSLIMLLIALPSAILVGPGWVEENLSGGQNYILYSLLIALRFTGGVIVLLQGVRMLIAELIPAFKGISDKLVPGAIPALDCPVIIPYGTTALMIGTVIGTVSQVVAIIGLNAIGWAVPLPSMIGSFFGAGHIAVVGNKYGGPKTAYIAAFIEGIFATFLKSLAFQFGMFGDLGQIGAEGIGPSSSDTLLIGTGAYIVDVVLGFLGINLR
jgi:PTS system ascorbate-specific IIC component